MVVLANHIMVTVLQYIRISSHHVVHTLTQYYLLIVFQGSWGKREE